MNLPGIHGVIRRRILVNFRVDPEVMQRFLPAPFRPKLLGEAAVAGICLIRLEQIRPRPVPALLGISSENAAHRVAVRWTDAAGEHEGVYIPRRDSNSLLNFLAGGRLFPGEHHRATFDVRDRGGAIDFSMRSLDGAVSVAVRGRTATALPKTSAFGSLEEASAFFENGALGYSATRSPDRLRPADAERRPRVAGRAFHARHRGGKLQLMGRDGAVWFAMIDGREAGPMSRAEFALRMATDLVNEETFVWKEGMGEWLPAAKVSDLAPMFQARVQAKQRDVRPPPPPAAALARAKPAVRGPAVEEEIVLELDAPAVKPKAAVTPAPVIPPPPRAVAAPARRGEDDGDDRTVAEMLPLGERVHQEEVAQNIFDPAEPAHRTRSKTGEIAIDSLNWAYARSKKEPRDTSKAIRKLSDATPLAVSALPRHPVTPSHATPPAGNRPVQPRRTAPGLPPAVVLAAVFAGGLAVGLAIFFLLRLLL